MLPVKYLVDHAQTHIGTSRHVQVTVVWCVVCVATATRQPALHHGARDAKRIVRARRVHGCLHNQLPTHFEREQQGARVEKRRHGAVLEEEGNLQEGAAVHAVLKERPVLRLLATRALEGVLAVEDEESDDARANERPQLKGRDTAAPAGVAAAAAGEFQHRIGA